MRVAAEALTTKAKSTGMESKLVWDLVIGVEADKIQDCAEKVIQDLEEGGESAPVKNKVTSAFDKLKLVTKKGGRVYSHVEELKLDVEDENKCINKCIYGFIATIRTGGTISVAYAHSCKK